MVLHAHFKKHIIALGGWLLMYTSGPPRPPVWQKTIFFPDFFLLPSLIFLGKVKKWGTFPIIFFGGITKV